MPLRLIILLLVHYKDVKAMITIFLKFEIEIWFFNFSFFFPFFPLHVPFSPVPCLFPFLFTYFPSFPFSRFLFPSLPIGFSF